MMKSDDELAKRLSASECAEVYASCATDLRAAFALVVDVEERLGRAFNASIDHRYVRFDDPKDVLAKIRREVWQALVQQLGIPRMMSPRRWATFQEDLKRKDLPEPTRANLEATFSKLLGEVPDMLGEAVEDIFSWVRPAEHTKAAGYKRNSQLECPTKIILSYVVDTQWSYGWHVNQHARQQLGALENIFSALDGKGLLAKEEESIVRVIERRDYVADGQPQAAFNGVGETPYFSFKAYKNGNLHLTFKRTDLLARFNAIAGGRRLRPAEAAE